MNNNIEYCLNCGHESHCGENCLQDYGESEKTVCCNYCRHEEVEKVGHVDIESFNGA